MTDGLVRIDMQIDWWRIRVFLVLNRRQIAVDLFRVMLPRNSIGLHRFFLGFGGDLVRLQIGFACRHGLGFFFLVDSEVLGEFCRDAMVDEDATAVYAGIGAGYDRVRRIDI